MITPNRLLGDWRGEENDNLIRALALLAGVLVLFTFAMREQLFDGFLYMEQKAYGCLGGFGPSRWIACLSEGVWPTNKLVSLILARFGGSQFPRIFNLVLWSISAFLVLLGLKPFYRSLVVPLIASIFWAVHSLQVATVATISGRGVLLGVIFFFGAVLYLNTGKRSEAHDIELAPPAKSNLVFWGLIALSVFSSPLFFGFGALLVLLQLDSLERLRSGEEDRFASPKFVVSVGLALSMVALAMGVVLSKPDPRFEGMPTSLVDLLGAGFGSLGFSAFLVVYPRPVVWERFVQSFDTPEFVVLGLVVFLLTLAGSVWSLLKKCEWSKTGIWLLLVGELGILFEPVMTKHPPSVASSTALLFGAAVLGAELFSVLWERGVYTVPARMSLVVALLILLGIAFVRNERLTQHWSEWDDLCSFFSTHYKDDPTLNILLAEYFLSEHNAEAAEKKLELVDGERFKYTLLLKARALRKLGKTAESLEYYRKYIEQTACKNSKSGAIVELAEALTELGKVDEAKELMQRYDVSGGRAEYFWGLVKEHEGEYEEAIEHFKNWLKTDPKDTRVLIALGRVLMKVERYQQAKGYLELALNIEASIKVVKMLSECYVRLDNCVQAENLIRRMELSPQLTKQEKDELKTLLDSVVKRCYGTEAHEEKSQPPSLPEAVE